MDVSHIRAAGRDYVICGAGGRNVGGVNTFGAVGAALTEFGGLVCLAISPIGGPAWCSACP